MLKLVEEFPNTKVDTILSWACSAKNSLSTVAGFSPNQLMFGTQTYLPNVLNSIPSDLENESSSKVVASGWATIDPLVGEQLSGDQLSGGGGGGSIVVLSSGFRDN